MQYMGGKSRIARYIAEIINNTLNGGGSILHRAFCKKHHPWLGCVGKRGKQIWQLKFI